MTATLEESPERWKLTHNDRLVLAYTLTTYRASQQRILGPTLTATLGESPERRRLAHNDCSVSAYIRSSPRRPILGLHPDGYPSESTAYIASYPDVTLGESPERWRLAHNDCSMSAYIGSSPDGHPSQQPILGPTLRLPSGSLLKDGGSPTMTARCQPIRVFT